MIAEQLLSRAAELRREVKGSERATAPDYNVFRLIDGGYRELTHDRILADLLDPYGSHGQGCLFLRAFLELLAGRAKKDTDRVAKIAPFLQDLISRMADQPPPAEWHVARQIERIDIRIQNASERLLIFIENKIEAPERKDQLKDYKQVLESYPNFCRRLLILLAPQAYETKGQPDLRLVYEKDIRGWLETVSSKIAACHVSEVVKQYVKFVSTLGSESQMSSYEGELLTLLESPEYIVTTLDIARVVSHVPSRLWSRFFEVAGQKLRNEFALRNFVGWHIVDENDARTSPTHGGFRCSLRRGGDALTVGLQYHLWEARTDYKWPRSLAFGITFLDANHLPQPREVQELRDQLKLDGYSTDEDTPGWTTADTAWWVGRKLQTFPLDEDFLVSCVLNCNAMADHAVQLILTLLTSHRAQIEAADKAVQLQDLQS